MKELAQVESALTTLEPNKEDEQFLTFLLSGEMYAIGILNIKEIIEYGQVTTVPMMPSFVRGIINLRGQVVPVVDLLVRFGRKSSEVGKRTCIVIVEVDVDDEKHDIGIVVDSVSEVLEINLTEIEKPPAFGAKLRADFISGMGKVNGRFVIILNAHQVLSISEMSALADQMESISNTEVAN